MNKSEPRQAGTTVPVSSGTVFRFSLGKSLGIFLGYWLVVFFLIVSGGKVLGQKDFYIPAGIAGGILLASGFFYLLSLYFTRRRFANPLFGFLVGIVAKTGVPLVAALVIYCVLGKILFNKTAVTLVIFYMFVMPFEIWLACSGDRDSKISEINQNKSGQE